MPLRCPTSGPGGSLSDDRPHRLARGGHWATAIVRASRRLTPAEKLLFALVSELDRGGARGCFMSQDERARQLGLGIRTVRDAEDRLESLGLLLRRRAGRSVELFPLLPDELPDEPPADSTETRDRRRWVIYSAEALDHCIAGQDEHRRNLPVSPEPTPAESAAVDHPTPAKSAGEHRQNLPVSGQNTGSSRRSHRQDSPVSPREPRDFNAPSVTLKMSETTECDTQECDTDASHPRRVRHGAPDPSTEPDPRTGRLRLRNTTP